MTEQSKPGGDAPQQQTPWWVNQASEIIAPRGPLPAKDGVTPPAPKEPAVASPPQKDAPSEQTADEPGQQQKAEAPAGQTAEEPGQQEAEAPAGQTAEEPGHQQAPSGESEEPRTDPSTPVESSPEGERHWDRALQDLEEGCSQVHKLVRSLHELRPDDSSASTIRSLESPLGKLEEAVQELSQLASPEDAVTDDPETRDRTSSLRGLTSSLPISSILGLLSANRKSGTLCVSSEEEQFTLEILEGDVVHASSDRSTREQLLGSILVARDKIGVEQLEDFYKRYTQSEAGETGHETLVSREDLMSALEEQVQELFNRLYSAGKGVFCFYEGGSSNVEQRIRINVTKLLLESARTQDELDRKPQTEQLDPSEPS